MNTAKFLAGAALATVVGLTMNLPNAIAGGKNHHGMIKCYGVAMKGKNDCGTAKHTCAGRATKDRDSSEWVFMKKVVCEKRGGKIGNSSKHMSYNKHRYNHHKHQARIG